MHKMAALFAIRTSRISFRLILMTPDAAVCSILIKVCFFIGTIKCHEIFIRCFNISREGEGVGRGERGRERESVTISPSKISNFQGDFDSMSVKSVNRR